MASRSLAFLATTLVRSRFHTNMVVVDVRGGDALRWKRTKANEALRGREKRMFYAGFKEKRERMVSQAGPMTAEVCYDGLVLRTQ